MFGVPPFLDGIGLEDMMAEIPIERPQSFLQFVTLIDKHQSKTSEALWYRGCGLSTYKLRPTLYRHKTIKTIAELAKLERNLMVRFRQRSIPFHERSLDNDWDTLFFMQHYRVPTRLLDWTENPFIALYFALTAAPYQIGKDGKPEFTKAAAIWVLNPVLWNRHALKHQSFDEGVLAPGDERLKGYGPTGDFSGMNNYPVALYGSHNSPRIVAQRGVFTVFGQKTQSMGYLYKVHSFPEGCLIKFVLSNKYICEIRKAIFRHGITESVVFPDLDGLALEIRRAFEFEV